MRRQLSPGADKPAHPPWAGVGHYRTISKSSEGKSADQSCDELFLGPGSHALNIVNDLHGEPFDNCTSLVQDATNLFLSQFLDVFLRSLIPEGNANHKSVRMLLYLKLA